MSLWPVFQANEALQTALGTLLETQQKVIAVQSEEQAAREEAQVSKQLAKEEKGKLKGVQQELASTQEQLTTTRAEVEVRCVTNPPTHPPFMFHLNTPTHERAACVSTDGGVTRREGVRRARARLARGAGGAGGAAVVDS